MSPSTSVPGARPPCSSWWSTSVVRSVSPRRSSSRRPVPASLIAALSTRPRPARHSDGSPPSNSLTASRSWWTGYGRRSGDTHACPGGWGLAPHPDGPAPHLEHRDEARPRRLRDLLDLLLVPDRAQVVAIPPAASAGGPLLPRDRADDDTGRCLPRGDEASAEPLPSDLPRGDPLRLGAPPRRAQG